MISAADSNTVENIAVNAVKYCRKCWCKPHIKFTGSTAQDVELLKLIVEFSNFGLLHRTTVLHT